MITCSTAPYHQKQASKQPRKVRCGVFTKVSLRAVGRGSCKHRCTDSRQTDRKEGGAHLLEVRDVRDGSERLARLVAVAAVVGDGNHLEGARDAHKHSHTIPHTCIHRSRGTSLGVNYRTLAAILSIRTIQTDSHEQSTTRQADET